MVEGGASTSSSSLHLDRERHVRYLEMMLHSLPWEYQEQEINLLTLAYFAISGVQILDALDHHQLERDRIARWVLSFQKRPRSSSQLCDGVFYGFYGSRSSQFPTDDPSVSNRNGGHLASTYSALAILKTVGYDMSSIDSESILLSMKNLQHSDGSFMPVHTGAERDLRFVYCAAAICFLLNDWSGMDKEKAKGYIVSCQSYDGGFGLVPGSESHGGATYCAVAALRLMEFINDDIFKCTTSPIDVPLLLDWILQRQAPDGGFQGRTNKASDPCYAFWLGGVLKILGALHLIDEAALRRFLLTCQSKYGGFSKFSQQLPDLYHSYYGVTAFGLLEEPGLKQLRVELGITYV